MPYIIAAAALVALTGGLAAICQRGRSQSCINARLKRYCRYDVLNARLAEACRSR